MFQFYMFSAPKNLVSTDEFKQYRLQKRSTKGNICQISIEKRYSG